MDNEENKKIEEVSAEQIQPEVTPKKSFKKWIFAAVIFLIILGISTGGYLFSKKGTETTTVSPTPTPASETANWKTYNSADNPFNFKYPDGPNWNLTIQGGAVDVQCPHISCPTPYNIYDFVIGKSNTNSIQQYISSLNTTNPNQNTHATPYISDYKQIKINGTDAVETLTPTGPLAGSGPIVSIFLVSNNVGYVLNYTYIDTKLNTITKLDQLPTPNPNIASTFKFTQSTVEPINAAHFTKTLVSQDNCSNPLGLIAYKSDNFDFMKINNTNTKQNTYSEKGISAVNNYLQDKASLTNLQDLNSWEFPFHDYCGGTTNIYLKELSTNKYTNTESSKALLEYTTQSMFGTTTVYVFARKGDNLIQLSSPIADEATYEKIGNKCHPNYKKDLSDFKPADEECYKNALSKDPELQKIATDKANDLIQTFALKQ